MFTYSSEKEFITIYNPGEKKIRRLRQKNEAINSLAFNLFQNIIFGLSIQILSHQITKNFTPHSTNTASFTRTIH